MKLSPLILRDFRLAFRNVYRQKRRSALALVAVAFGTIALLVGGGFIEWILWAAREGSIQSGLGHIQIVRPRYFETGLADPGRYMMPLHAPERAWLEQLPDVKTVAPRVALSGLVSLEDSTVSFLGEGVDAARELDFTPISIIVRGEDLSPDDPKGVIMGKGLADNLGAKVGDQVVLLRQDRGRLTAAEVRIRGLFATLSKAYDDSTIRMPLSVATQLTKNQDVHKWIVVLRHTELTDRYVDQLRIYFTNRNFEIVPWIQLADFYKKTVELLNRQMGVIKAIIAIIIVLSISNTMTMNVLQRTSEIGTAMALGATRLQILRRFLFEGLFIGALGGGFGLAVGTTMALGISAVGIPMPPPPGMDKGYTGEIRLTGDLLFDAAALALCTAIVAALYPAWKASRLNIVDALRQGK